MSESLLGRATAAYSLWSEAKCFSFDLPTSQTDIETAEETSQISRRTLQDQTKIFFRLSDQEKLAAIKDLLKCHRDEIDALTLRSRQSEGRIVSILSSIPTNNPADILKEVEVEVAELQEKVADCMSVTSIQAACIEKQKEEISILRLDDSKIQLTIAQSKLTSLESIQQQSAIASSNRYNALQVEFNKLELDNFNLNCKSQLISKSEATFQRLVEEKSKLEAMLQQQVNLNQKARNYCSQRIGYDCNSQVEVCDNRQVEVNNNQHYNKKKKKKKILNKSLIQIHYLLTNGRLDLLDDDDDDEEECLDDDDDDESVTAAGQLAREVQRKEYLERENYGLRSQISNQQVQNVQVNVIQPKTASHGKFYDLFSKRAVLLYLVGLHLLVFFALLHSL